MGQFTDTYSDGHTRSQLLKGGSYYRPSGSGWYFRHCIELRTHNKYVRSSFPPFLFFNVVNMYLLFDAGYDRAGTVGFRCVADASPLEAIAMQQY